MTRPVVVTGMGCVLAGGAGVDALAAKLAAGEAPTCELEAIAGLHRPCSARRAVLADGVELGSWLSPLVARRMSRVSRLGVAASRMALDAAGLPAEAGADETMATVFATAFGPSEYTEQILEQIFEESPEAVSPFLFAESVANAAAAQVARLTGARGTNVAITQREASPLLALASGALEVAEGRAECALVGAADEMNPLLHAALDRFRALARPAPDGEQARPFDRRRDGFLAGEGSAALVAEPEAVARQRGAVPLARFGGATAAFDPTAPPWGWGDGAARLAAALRRGLERHGVDPGDIDLIVAGANGARDGDRVEAEVLRRVWEGRPLPPVVAPKGVTGEVGGVLLAAPLLALTGRTLGATAGFTTADPQIGFEPYGGGPLPPVRRVLVSALATGGAAAWAWLEAVEG